jgi:hypothetical protein
VNTELTFPLSSNVALFGIYEPFAPPTDVTTDMVAALNSKTVNQARTFVGTCSDDFILTREHGEIVHADQFIQDIRAGPVDR